LAQTSNSRYQDFVHRMMLRRKKHFYRILRELPPLEKDYIPGRRTKRPSRFGRMLIRKQRFLLFYYPLRDRQMRRLLIKANNRSRFVFQNFLELLECRMIVVIFRSGMFPGVYPPQLKQLFSHKRIPGLVVSGTNRGLFVKTGYSPHISFSPGDYIIVPDYVITNFFRSFKRKKNNFFRLSSLKRKRLFPPPRYLEVNYSLGLIIFANRPRLTEVSYPFGVNIPKIVSFYRHLGVI
jgi:ribosomal protein S4